MRCLSAILAGLTALSFAGCSCDDEYEVSATAISERDAECGAYVLVPARYETVLEQVCIQEPSVQKQQIEAEYQTVSDTVVDVPGHWAESTTPAEFKDVTEQVLVTPGRKEWQKVPCAKVPLNSGELKGDAYCLVDIPPVYETRTKKITCKEACTQRTWVPPVYKTVERRVMVSAAREIDVPVEGKYEMRERKELVTPERWEWRWGNDCEPGEVDMGPRADRPSPPPPFPVGTSAGPPRTTEFFENYENQNR